MDWTQLVSAFSTGLFVALVTGLILGPRKAAGLPFGSMMAGFMSVYAAGMPLVLLGSFAGLGGWLAYVGVVIWAKRRGLIRG